MDVCDSSSGDESEVTSLASSGNRKDANTSRNRNFNGNNINSKSSFQTTVKCAVDNSTEDISKSLAGVMDGSTYYQYPLRSAALGRIVFKIISICRNLLKFILFYFFCL